MNTYEGLTDLNLQRVLWACLAYWNTEPNPPDKRAVCYSWVARWYKDRFGGTFHQSRLEQLARMGLLTKADTSRGWNRRYYQISDPQRLGQSLKKWNLN